MTCLLDTNILLRLVQIKHPMHREARLAVRSLLQAKAPINIVPQNIYEFWVVATRPLANNGLGMAAAAARRRIEKAASFFPLLPDAPGVYQEWLRIVDTYSVLGVNAHDARLVAAMRFHGISHFLTFNLADFKRYDGKEIIVISPSELSTATKS